MKISRNWCCAHTLSNTGKRIIETDNDVHNFAELFWINWQSIIQHPGKTREYVRSTFKESVMLAGGVQFFVKFEQICQ